MRLTTVVDYVKRKKKMIILFYFVLMNLITFVFFLTDKRRARSGQYQRRVPERTLLLLCFIGGAIGGIFGMYQLKHKTKKAKFVIGVPMAIVMNVFLVLGSIYIYTQNSL